jgi:hypothetical protein
MGYQCDICTTDMPSKSAGTFFDQSRVLTSPGYWKYLYTEAPTRLTEEVVPPFIARLCRDTSGYTVCDKCRDMLQRDAQLGREYDIEHYIESIPSGLVSPHSVGIVAGTVWKKLHGKWPSKFPTWFTLD